MPNNNFIERCRISYQGEVISDEPLMRDVWDFLMNDDERVATVLSTGSKCFDIVATVVAILKMIKLNKVSNDDIMNSLREGDMVIMRFPNGYQTRRVWLGIETVDGEEVIKTMEDINNKNASPSISTILKRDFKGTIRPYNGESKDTGSKGIRQEVTGREAFLARLLGVSKEEVPACFEVVLAVVTDNERFRDIIDNVEIYYDGNEKVKLTDLVPFARLTMNGEESQYGKNVAKDRPVVVFTERISNIREVMFDNKEREFGILILKEPYENEGFSELASIMGANWVKFMKIVVQIESALGEYLVKMDKNIRIYPCTKNKLKNFQNPARSNNMVNELYGEIQSIIDNKVIVKQVDGGVDEEEYDRIYRQIRGLDSQDGRIEDFKKYALSLMKLFNTACFNLETFEMLLQAGQINTKTVSPLERIRRMRELATSISDETCELITEEVEVICERLFERNPKQEELLNTLEQYGTDKNILIVVSKAFYIDIMKQIIDSNDYPNVHFTTVGKYRPNIYCDVVIAMSSIAERKFDPLRCKVASGVVLLIYKNEQRYYNAARKRNDAWLKRIELRMENGKVTREEMEQIENEEKHAREVLESFSNFDQMLNEIERQEIIRGIGRVDDDTNRDGDGNETEVKYVGIFSTEEKIFFTDYYTAVVFDEELGEVKEKSVEDLASGDTIMFLKNDKYTQNIVDFVFLDLKQNQRMPQVVLDAYEKSRYWKKVLRDYREQNKISFTELRKRISDEGVELSTVAIMSWLMNDSRIVGPRKAGTMEAIARVTRDKMLLEDANSYYEACGVVRGERIKIRHLIERAMKDKMSGNVPSPGSIEEMIYMNVDKMVELMELNEIIKLDKPLSIKSYLANKPIKEKKMEE